MTNHTGKMRKDVDGVIRGELRDKFGWGLSFVATPDPAGGYTLVGEFVRPSWDPDIPGVDVTL